MSQMVITSTIRMIVLAGIIMKSKKIAKKINKESLKKFNLFEFLAEVCLMGIVVRVAWGV